MKRNYLALQKCLDEVLPKINKTEGVHPRLIKMGIQSNAVAYVRIGIAHHLVNKGFSSGDVARELRTDRNKVLDYLIKYRQIFENRQRYKSAFETTERIKEYILEFLKHLK